MFHESNYLWYFPNSRILKFPRNTFDTLLHPLNRRAPRQSIDMGHIGKVMWGTSVYLLLRIFWRPPFFLSRFGALPVCLAPRLFSLVKGS